MVIQLGVTHGDRYGVRGGDLVHVELLKNWGDGGGEVGVRWTWEIWCGVRLRCLRSRC